MLTKTLKVVALVITMLCASAVYAGALEDGVAAYYKKNYALAVQKYEELAIISYNLEPEASENDTGSVSVAVISLAIVSVLPTNDSGVGFKVVVVVVKIYAAPLFDVPLLAPSSKCAPAIA